MCSPRWPWVCRLRWRRPPSASINFVTAHDGFTLQDLVSYEQKHNDANGEENRDGSNDNHSRNWGVEGVTTDGLAYPLVDEPLPIGRTRGLSNVRVSDEARVTVRRGLLLVVESPATL